MTLTFLPAVGCSHRRRRPPTSRNGPSALLLYFRRLCWRYILLDHLETLLFGVFNTLVERLTSSVEETTSKGVQWDLEVECAAETMEPLRVIYGSPHEAPREFAAIIDELLCE